MIFLWRISLRFYSSGQNTARLQQLREVSCRIQVDFTDDEKIQSCLKTPFSWLLNWEGCSVVFQKVLQPGSWLLKYFRIIFLSANDPLIDVCFPSNTMIVVPGYSKPVSLPHPHSPCPTWWCQLCLLGYCKSLLTVLIPFVLLTASSKFSPSHEFLSKMKAQLIACTCSKFLHFPVLWDELPTPQPSWKSYSIWWVLFICH